MLQRSRYATAYSIANDSVADELGYRDPYERALAGYAAGFEMKRKVLRSRTAAALPQTRKIGAPLQAAKAPHHTLRRLRPFLRRALSTRRPFLVDMRSRKP